MRKKIKNAKSLCVLSGALICAVCCYLLWHSPVFAGGEGYELYFGTSSGPVVQTEHPVLSKWLAGNVAGESVRYEGDVYRELKDRFDAELLFCERVQGSLHYYLYSPLLGDCVQIGGYAVNLHLVVGGGRTVAGTPLIFGGT